jgi:hypothetical protein
MGLAARHRLSEDVMFARFRLRTLLPLAAIGITALLVGCVYDPYGYYGYTAPGSVNFAFGGWGQYDHHWQRHWDH